MVELDDSQAGPASAVSEEMHTWAAEQVGREGGRGNARVVRRHISTLTLDSVPPVLHGQVFKLAREQGAQPQGFWENAQGREARGKGRRGGSGDDKGGVKR